LTDELIRQKMLHAQSFLGKWHHLAEKSVFAADELFGRGRQTVQEKKTLLLHINSQNFGE
jgi:hypothetical protein